MVLSGPETVEVVTRDGELKVLRYAAMRGQLGKVVFVGVGLLISVPLGLWLGWVPGLLVAMIFVYPLAASCFNSSLVRIDSKQLKWSYGPLPAKARRQVLREEIEALVYGRMKEKRRKHQTPILAYSVGLRKRGGKLWVLFQDMPTEQSAREAARLLGEMLGMKRIEVGAMPAAKAIDQKAHWVLAGICVTLAVVAWRLR